LEVGLLLDKTEANRVLDQGPTAEQSDLSAAFREFWGEKAELRRFKDGSITESVIWHVARPEERALIPGKIVAWVVDRHFNINGNFIAWTSPDMQKMLQVPPTSHRLKMVEGSEKLGFRPAMDAFDKLYKIIKAADDDLPLSILNFTPASEYLRYTSTFVPHPVDIARMQAAPSSVRYMPAFDVMMQFESSGKWPDDLVAVQKIKLAFMEKLARLLEDKIADVSVKIVLEPGAPDIQDHASLEVVVSEGFAFHLRIFHDREGTLLLRMVEDPDLSSPKLRKIALESLRLHVRRYTLLPRHHSAIATLHHMHPSFATATRLLKRWISAHMLSQHLSGEFVELVTAGVYLTGGPSGIPATAIAGFYRALYRLAHWDWKGIPMIVPLYTATTENKDNNPADTTNVSFRSDLMSSALAQFKEERKSDPHCLRTALCVVTEEDLDGTVWTRSNESGKVIAGRLVTLARAACEVMAQAGSDSMDLPAEVSNIPRSGSNEYTMLIM
jgi:U3 small nucleolar RNA-associated protein 22